MIAHQAHIQQLMLEKSFSKNKVSLEENHLHIVNQRFR